MKKNTRTNIMIAVLIGLLIVAYKVLFMSSEEVVTDGNVVASARVDAILKQIQSINFDTGILNDPKMRSLKSLETPLPTLPVGKSNPFSI